MTRNGPSALALPATAVVAMMWLVIGCSVGGTEPHTAPPTAPVDASAPISTPAAPQATPTAQAIETAPDQTMYFETPPAGSLGVESGAPAVEGLLGTFCWKGACLDSVAFTDRQPDLPTIEVADAGDQLEFTLQGSYPFGEWSASYVADDGSIVELGSADASFDPDAAGATFVPVTQTSFPAPPAGGAHIVQVFVRFAEGGDASYGWNVSVE
jgi:hypothetical protein